MGFHGRPPDWLWPLARLRAKGPRSQGPLAAGRAILIRESGDRGFGSTRAKHYSGLMSVSDDIVAFQAERGA